MLEMVSGIWVIWFCERLSSWQAVIPTAGRMSTTWLRVSRATRSHLRSPNLGGRTLISLSDTSRNVSLWCTATHVHCTVWVKKNPSWGFLTFFSNGWEFLVQILLANYTFLSTLDYLFLFNYLKLWRSHIKCNHPACVSSHGGHFEHMMGAELISLIWHNFVKVAYNWIKNCHWLQAKTKC